MFERFLTILVVCPQAVCKIKSLKLLYLFVRNCTYDPQRHQLEAAIPLSAFADAAEDYNADEETDDEGDMIEA